MSSIIVQEFLQNNISIFKQIFIVDLHYTLDQKDMHLCRCSLANKTNPNPSPSSVVHELFDAYKTL